MRSGPGGREAIAASGTLDVAVVAYPPAWRLIASVLKVVAHGSLLATLALLAFSDNPPTNPFKQLRLFAGLFAAPEVAAWCLAKAFAGRARIEGTSLVIALRDRRVEVPLAAIAAARPWFLPLPGEPSNDRWRGLGGVFPVADSRWFEGRCLPWTRLVDRATVGAMSSFHDFPMRGIDGKIRSLSGFAGKTVLVVNVASQCGLTPQYAALEDLQKKYADRGFTVLGFPCNQFAGQEPGSEAEIQAFCSTSFGVTFPLSAKVEVNGEGRDPLYAWLTTQTTAPDGPGDIKWNFAKFLVGRDGQVRARYSPVVAPDDAALVADLEAALA